MSPNQLTCRSSALMNGKCDAKTRHKTGYKRKAISNLFACSKTKRIRLMTNKNNQHPVSCDRMIRSAFTQIGRSIRAPKPKSTALFRQVQNQSTQQSRHYSPSKEQSLHTSRSWQVLAAKANIVLLYYVPPPELGSSPVP